MAKEEASVIPSSTKLSTEREAKKFKNFLIENNLSDKIESMPSSVLSKYLRFYYFKLQAKNGKPYAPRTLISIRAAIHRYLISAAVNRNINIIEDKEFQRPNAMLKAKVAQYLKSGDKERQFPTIQNTDLQKLNEYFTRSSPKILQEEVWFVLTYYLGLRGRELHHCIQHQWLEIGTDSSNRRYIRLKHNYLSKNVKASLKQKKLKISKTDGYMIMSMMKGIALLRRLKLICNEFQVSSLHCIPCLQNASKKEILRHGTAKVKGLEKIQ